jgi:hypothetical protein
MSAVTFETKTGEPASTRALRRSVIHTRYLDRVTEQYGSP